MVAFTDQMAFGSDNVNTSVSFDSARNGYLQLRISHRLTPYARQNPLISRGGSQRVRLVLLFVPVAYGHAASVSDKVLKGTIATDQFIPTRSICVLAG
jgi:hypothetical protein